MSDEPANSLQRPADVSGAGHPLWVRACHWVQAAAVLTLGVTGVFILMVHPRLYWGEVGNDLVPAFIELPISDNHRPEGWRSVVAYDLPGAPVTGVRTYEIFNENGWGRSLHFLAGWFLVIAGALYVGVGLLTGHLKRDLLPSMRDLRPKLIWRELTGRSRSASGGGQPYGFLQRTAYVLIALIVLPFMVVAGLTMSPTVTAALPGLLELFGGYQSARTWHFFGFVVLAMFALVHVIMVFRTGFVRQMRAMIMGN